MSYHRYIREELEPEVLLMFEYVNFDNQIEDTAQWRLSEPIEQQIRLDRDTILPNGEFVLRLDPEFTDTIEIYEDEGFPGAEYTLVLWLRPESAGERAVLTFGGLSIVVDEVTEETYDIVVSAGPNATRVTGPRVSSQVIVTRSSNQFAVYVGGQQVESFTQTGVANGSLLIGEAPGVDNTAVVHLQGVSLHNTVLSPAQIDDLYNIGTVGYLTRRAETSDSVRFAFEDATALQAEWQIISV